MTVLLQSSGPYQTLLEGGISHSDLQLILKHISQPLKPNFLQKKMIVLLSQLAFRKLDTQHRGFIYPSDLCPQLPKLLLLFAGSPPYHSSEIPLQASRYFQHYCSHPPHEMSSDNLAQVLLPFLPKTLPQKSFVAQLGALTIFFLMGIPHTQSITQENWIAFSQTLYQTTHT